MIVEYNGQQIEVEISDIDNFSERHGSYIVQEQTVTFSYDADVDPDQFEDFLHANHINELIQIYQDEN
jgi:hypothetical protein